MQVQVRLGHGLSRLADGCQLHLVKVGEEATVAEAIDCLCRSHPRLSRAMPAVVPVVRGRHVERTERLAGGDEVALISPVSGG